MKKSDLSPCIFLFEDNNFELIPGEISVTIVLHAHFILQVNEEMVKNFYEYQVCSFSKDDVLDFKVYFAVKRDLLSDYIKLERDKKKLNVVAMKLSAKPSIYDLDKYYTLNNKMK